MIWRCIIITRKKFFLMYLEGYPYKEEFFFSNVFGANITRKFYFFSNVFGSNIAKKNFSSTKGKHFKKQNCKHFHFWLNSCKSLAKMHFWKWSPSLFFHFLHNRTKHLPRKKKKQKVPITRKINFRKSLCQVNVHQIH